MNERDTTLTIDRFNLQLPAGFERRGDAIARETLRLLSKRSIGLQGRLPAVDISGLRIRGGETDGVIARQICRAIEQQLVRHAGPAASVKGASHVD